MLIFASSNEVEIQRISGVIEVTNNKRSKKFEFTFIDLFSGIGGFHQALKELGGECKAACEIDDKARETYLANHQVPEGKFFKDITKIDINIVPDHDVLCAGFPCQPFSISGKKNALEDSRSHVISSLFRIIKKKKPKMVMLENVKHIKHVSDGTVFKYIVESLRLLGYKVSFELLNSKDFGVSQNRERWLFVGVLAAKEFEFKYDKCSPVLLKNIIQKRGTFTYMEEAFTLIENPKKQMSGLIFVGYRNKKIRTNGVREGTHHLSRTHKQPNRIYSINGLHPTIPSQETSGRFWILLNDGRVRKLTIKECFRIMGYDDSFKKPVSDGNLYKQIGNSVCVPMIKVITETLLSQMGYKYARL